MSRLELSRRTVSAALVLIVIGSILGAASAVVAASIKSTGGPVSATYSVTSQDTATLNAPLGELVNGYVPAMTRAVQVPDGQTAILTITFSAETDCVTFYTGGHTACHLTATVDGQNLGWVTFARSEPSSGFHMESHSMQWVAGPLTSGTHYVRIRWSTPEDNMRFTLNMRTLTVLRSRPTSQRG